jgi:hypothetical protein
LEFLLNGLIERFNVYARLKEEGADERLLVYNKGREEVERAKLPMIPLRS